MSKESYNDSVIANARPDDVLLMTFTGFLYNASENERKRQKMPKGEYD